MTAKNDENLNIFTVYLFIVCQMTKCIVLTVQCFYLSRSKGPLIPLSARYKRVTITFQEKQKLNIQNHYHKDATYLTPGIIEKFKETHNIILHQIDETLSEPQMKFSQIVKALDKILCQIGKQGISYRETQETAAKSDNL